LGQFISWFANRIKAITGATNWYDAPATTLAAAKSHMDSTSNPHSVTAAQLGAVNTAGDTMTGNLIINPAAAAAILILFGEDNAGIEIGRKDGVSSTPYIDFHSGATAVDHDTRIIASGGTGVNGGGTLNVEAANFTKGGNTIWHAGNDGPGSGLDADLLDGLHASEMSGAKIIPLVSFQTYCQPSGFGEGNTAIEVADSVDFVYRDLSEHKFLWQSGLASGRDVYFEVVMQSNAADTTVYAALRQLGTSPPVLYGTLSTSSTEAVRLRSGALSLPDGAEFCVSFYNPTLSGGIGKLFVARLVII
jgi:hypothetical protein